MIQKSGRIVIAGDPDDVFDCMEKAVKIASIGEYNANKTIRTITIRTDVSWRSWGEDVMININPLTDTQTEISISSGGKFQLVDWGKNSINIENILDMFSQKWEALLRQRTSEEKKKEQMKSNDEQSEISSTDKMWEDFYRSTD